MSHLRALFTALLVAGMGSSAIAQERDDVFDVDEAETFVSPSGSTRVDLMLNETSAPGTPAAMSVLTMQPGAAVPEHLHDGAAEILYVMHGGGTVTIGGVEQTLAVGSVVYIPADTLHSYVNDTGTHTKVVQVYVGPGSEARFRDWPPLSDTPSE